MLLDAAVLVNLEPAISRWAMRFISHKALRDHLCLPLQSAIKNGGF